MTLLLSELTQSLREVIQWIRFAVTFHIVAIEFLQIQKSRNEKKRFAINGVRCKFRMAYKCWFACQKKQMNEKKNGVSLVAFFSFNSTLTFMLKKNQSNHFLVMIRNLQKGFPRNLMYVIWRFLFGKNSFHLYWKVGQNRDKILKNLFIYGFLLGFLKQ